MSDSILKETLTTPRTTNHGDDNFPTLYNEGVKWELGFARVFFFFSLGKWNLGHWDWESKNNSEKKGMGLGFGQKVEWEEGLGNGICTLLPASQPAVYKDTLILVYNFYFCHNLPCLQRMLSLGFGFHFEPWRCW